MHLTKTDRVLLKLIIVASLMAASFEAGRWLHELGFLPFGFRYQVGATTSPTGGSLIKIDRPKIAEILKAHHGAQKIVFFSDIYARNSGRIFIHVSRPESVLLFVGGKTIPLGTKKHFIPLSLKKGFTPVQIRYTIPALSPADLHIAFSENATLVPFPFFRLLHPGKPFSFPRVAFYTTVMLEQGQTLVFSLILLLIMLRTFLVISKRPVPERGVTISVFQLLFQVILNVFTIFNILVFCFFFLKIGMPLAALFWFSLPSGLFSILPSIRNKRLRASLDWKKIVVFSTIALIVLFYVFASCGSFLPPDPIGFGDLNAHLRMIKSIEFDQRFLEGEQRRIYPQSIHATIVGSAAWLGLETEEWITTFLMIMLVLLLFAIYLLGNKLFPGIPLFWWLVALAISNSLFIFRSIFINHSFPAPIAVSFFFFAIYFYLGKYILSASLSLAASICFYPYFAPAFLFGFVILHFGLASPLFHKKWSRLAVSLLPSIFLTAIYVVVYLNYGFSQQKEGFVTAYLLNPFSGLRFWNTALILAAVIICFSIKTAKPALAFFFTLVGGFILQYAPYALFHAYSTYYVMKNMVPIISGGIIYAAAALFFITRYFPKLKFLLPAVFITILAVLVVPFYHQILKDQPRVSRGATAVNRWLLKNTPATDPILVQVNSSDLFQFFSLTLGTQRKLIRGAKVNFPFSPEPGWLVIDAASALSIAKANNLQPQARFNDFFVYRFIKLCPRPQRSGGRTETD